MEWNVYYHDINRNKMNTYNIFKHHTFCEYVRKAVQECKNKDEFAERLKSELQFYFWAKAEWEIILAPWCGGRNTREIKVDIYDQVMLNWDVFVDYVWSHKE